ncbi:MAG: M56 family metallopeptidase [Planctomycetota bacterium]
MIGEHPFFAPLLSWIWQITLLFGIVWISARALRHSSARLRHALWLLVLARLVIPPIGWWPEAIRPSLLPASWQRVLAPWESATLVEPIGKAQGVRPPNTSVDVPKASAGESTPRSPAPERASRLASIVSTLWVTGSALFLAWLALQSIALRRCLRSAQRPPAELERVFSKLCRRLGIRRRVRLLEVTALESPATVQWWRPTVLLPVHVSRELSAEELESVLVHELLHVRRRDLEVHWLASLTRAVHFYHPVAWWTVRFLCRERELAVDECAVRQGGLSMNLYRKTLVRVASLLASAPRALPRPSIALSEGARDLKHRLLQLERTSGSRVAWMALVPAALLLAISLIAPMGDARTAAGDDMSPAELERWMKLQSSAARIELPKVQSGGLAVSRGSVGGIILIKADGRLEAKTVRAATDGRSFELQELPLEEAVEVIEEPNRMEDDVFEPVEEIVEEPVEEVEVIEEPEVEEEIVEEPVVEEVEIIEEPEVEEVEIVEEPEEIFEEEEILEEPMIDDFGLDDVTSGEQDLVKVELSREGSSLRILLDEKPVSRVRISRGVKRLQIVAGERVTVSDVAGILDRAHAAGIRRVMFGGSTADPEGIREALQPLARLSAEDFVSSKEIVVLADGAAPWSTMTAVLTTSALNLRNPRISLAVEDATGRLRKLSTYLPVDVGLRKD